jgi:deoxyadenosine/deoxycytidine kinase
MWVTIEGNIGCGKTTLLEALKAKHPEWTFAPEPVDQWTLPQSNLNDKSMLDLF